jgi:hypothetical protein
MPNHPITPYPEVNTIVADLVAGVQALLGDQVIGIYLDGSLAYGDFDQNSDIDFIVVTRDEISSDHFVALQHLHDQITASASPWATELEGSYISQRALWRHDPVNAYHPNIERGPTERLKMVQHGTGWVIHRQIMREQGIVICGPPPHTLIDAITPSDLRQAVQHSLRDWAPELLANTYWSAAEGYHSYIVLTLCRILYTIATGSIASKRSSVVWARSALTSPWRELIEHAWVVRQTWRERQPDATSTMAEHADLTCAYIRYALERC